MSEENTTSKGDAPKAPRTPKSVATSSINVRFAKVKGIDETRAGKLNRSYMRSNYAVLIKIWQELRKSQKVNRDGNRWQTSMPAKVADMIVKRQIPQSRAK